MSKSGKFVLLNWNSIEDISLAYDKDGSVLVFESNEAAEKFAKKNYAWEWQVVEVE